MGTWLINVRAIVAVSGLAADEAPEFAGWDQYDQENVADGEVRIRCDRIVSVEAATEAEAIEAAKMQAPGIETDVGTIDDVILWVDDGIDVNPEGAEEILAMQDGGASPTP